MIKSKYIANVLELLLDGDIDGLLTREQLPFLTEEKFEYTSGGLFVYFKHSDEVLKYQITKNDLVLNGVKIRSTEYEIEADAILFLKDGLINYLEIWCYLGDYPKQELTKYTLTQNRVDIPNKILSTEN